MLCELSAHLLVSVDYVCDGVHNTAQDNINMLPEVCFIQPDVSQV